jgi:hypothetical protein
MSVVNVSKSFIAQERGRADRCHRCGGLMVPEKVFEIGSIDWHCVSCGERVDPVILAHRKGGSAPIDAENAFAGKGKARLN